MRRKVVSVANVDGEATRGWLVFGLENTHTGKIKSMRKREREKGRYEVSG